MSLRVAYLLEFPTLLGGERSWLAMLPRLVDVEPVAVAPPDGQLARALQNAVIQQVPFDWPAVGPEGRAELLAPLLAEEHIDLIHANSLTTSLCAADLGQRLGRPAIGHCRDIMRLNHARVACLNRLQALIAVSHATARHLETQGVSADVLRVIHNGIDAADAWNPASLPPNASAMRAAAGLPADARVIAWVGQLVLRKDPLAFLQALPSVLARHADVHAVLLGARHSQKDEAVEYEATLRQLADGEALRGRVHFLGEHQDVREWLVQADLVVHTAQQDPLCRVLLEAAALARPIVATHVGGTGEILDNGIHGLLVAPSDIPAISAAMLTLLADRSHATTLGQQARTRIIQEFTPASTAAKIQAVYQAVTDLQASE